MLMLLESCSIFPKEFNLGPIYRHRLDEKGELLSCDVLWPIFHYEKGKENAGDFRARPLFRKISRPGKNEEFQFIWPFGRAFTSKEESSFRIFPLVWWRNRNLKDGEDLDWYFLFPIFWGGMEKGRGHFGFFPIYGRIPEFLSYDQVGWYLFPFYVWTEKGKTHSRSILWPFFGKGWSDDPRGPTWFRALPFYAKSRKKGQWDHTAILWPFFQWGKENMSGKDPRSYWFFFPLAGSSKGKVSSAFTLAWPFFNFRCINRESYKYDIPWPIIRICNERFEKPDGTKGHFSQCWVMPIFASTNSEEISSLVILFPFVWVREHKTPYLKTKSLYFLPLFYSVTNEHPGGKKDSYAKFFPLFSVEKQENGDSTLRILDPFPFRLDKGEGYYELYDFLWNLFTYKKEKGHISITTPANIFCYDHTEASTTWSIPFLGHVEKTKKGRTVLRLFHLIPITLKGEKEKK